MAKGSRRTTPLLPTAAAVVSDPRVAAMYTPEFQSDASYTSGIVVRRRPPKTNAEMGTPRGSSQLGSIEGHWLAGAVKREFGWAAVRPDRSPISGVQSFPVQPIRCAGGSFVLPSHHTSPSSVKATLVKITLSLRVAMALWLVCSEVPGATPKNPASGLMA